MKSRARRMGVRKSAAGRVGALYPRGRALELRGLEGRVGGPRPVKGGARVTKDMGRDREEGVTRRAADLSTRRVREGAGLRSRAMRKWTWAASGAGPDADAGGGARGRAQVSRATAPSAPPPWVPSAGRADGGWRRLRPRPGPAPSWAAEPAPVAAAGEALPPASAARGGREGERPAQSVPVGGWADMGGASPSCASEPHTSPLFALRLSASWPLPRSRRPPGPHPFSRVSFHCLSHALVYVSSAHPPIYSAQDPVSFCTHPCCYGFFLLLIPFPVPSLRTTALSALSPKPPFPLILLPSSLPPCHTAHLPSAAVLAAGKVCSLVCRAC